MTNSNKIFRYFLWLGIITSTCALAVYAYLGLFTRYMADDYCLLVNLQTDNVFSASLDKYLLSSNRFSNLFVISLWEIFPNSIAFVPALHIILWVAGLTWILYECKHLFNWNIQPALLFLTAELLALFSLFTTPNTFQVLYWRSGQVTYFTPLVLFTFILAWLLKITRSELKVNRYIPIFILLAFFSGGLSETIGIFHISILSLMMLVTYFFSAPSPRRKIALTLLMALLVGAFSALLIMFLAPANALRINPEKSSPTMVQVVFRSLDFTYAFLIDSFRSLPIPFIVLSVIFTLCSLIIFTKYEDKVKNPRLIWLLLIIPLITYAIIFATFAPSAYGQSYPVERVRFPAFIILNIGIMLLSVCLGYFLSYIKLNKLTNSMVLAVILLALFYPLWMIRQPMQTYEYRRLWAKRWDERKNMIYTAISNGETDILVPALDGYEGTKELELASNYWINKCAAQYYGVNSLGTFQLREDNDLDYFSE